jgi:GNAT superfamily N-acetyltransferase
MNFFSKWELVRCKMSSPSEAANRVCLRDFKPGLDLIALAELDERALGVEVDMDEFALSLDNKLCVVAYLESEPSELVGYILFGRGRDHWTLARLMVDPDQRRRGIGSVLLGGLLKLCRKSDRRQSIRTSVPDDLLDLHLFLRTNSFRAARVVRANNHPDHYEFEFRANENVLSKAS